MAEPIKAALHTSPFSLPSGFTASGHKRKFCHCLYVSVGVFNVDLAQSAQIDEVIL